MHRKQKTKVVYDKEDKLELKDHYIIYVEQKTWDIIQQKNWKMCLSQCMVLLEWKKYYLQMDYNLQKQSLQLDVYTFHV